MRRYASAILLALLWVAPLVGQVKTPAAIQGEANKPLYVKADTEAKSVVWLCFDQGLLVTPQSKLASKVEAQVVGPAGTYRLLAFVVVNGELSYSESLVTLGQPGPIPPGPIPPGPIPPGPIPPGPVPPTPTPAPIPAAGLRVLMVWDAKATLPADQYAIFFGKQVRDALDAKCVVGPNGKTKEYRMFPSNTDPSKAPKLWADALARPRTSLPWVIISNGVSGYEGPMPQTPEAFLVLLAKYDTAKGSTKKVGWK